MNNPLYVDEDNDEIVSAQTMSLFEPKSGKDRVSIGIKRGLGTRHV